MPSGMLVLPALFDCRSAFLVCFCAHVLVLVLPPLARLRGSGPFSSQLPSASSGLQSRVGALLYWHTPTATCASCPRGHFSDRDTNNPTRRCRWWTLTNATLHLFLGHWLAIGFAPFTLQSSTWKVRGPGCLSTSSTRVGVGSPGCPPSLAG